MLQLKDQAAGSVCEMVPPFAATCRAEPATDSTKYSRCLVDVSVICAYRSNPFGVDHFCLHPRHKEIVARAAGK